jgi:O-antigen ligase
MVKLFKYYLILLLIGYATFNKGFAYIHIPGPIPIYLGEIGLFIGLLLAIANLSIIYRSLNSYVSRIYILFALLGIIMLIPGILKYGIDAVRDSAIWYYGIYALILGGIFRTYDDIYKFLNFYKSLVLVLLVFIPIYIFLVVYIGVKVPTFPNSPVPIIYPKFGDLGVHLGGVVCFVLLSSILGIRMPFKPLIYLLIGLGFISVGSINRGGFVAAVFSTLLVSFLFFKPSNIVKVLVIIVFLTLIFYVLDINFETGYRSISSQQLLLNISSIVRGSEAPGELAGTVYWRVMFWTTILQNIKQHWLGVGFGPVLAYVYDFPYIRESPDVPILRNAHNSHLTILARMGILGFLLWLVMLFLYFKGLYRIKNSPLSPKLRGTAGWLIGYSSASVINAIFDPSLESPMGGILFWSLIGLGVALSRLSTKRINS